MNYNHLILFNSLRNMVRFSLSCKLANSCRLLRGLLVTICLISLGSEKLHGNLIDGGDVTIIDQPGNPSDGLRYLDLSFSDNLSLADALANARATYPNARLATPSEANDLFNASTLTLNNANFNLSEGWQTGFTTQISTGGNYNVEIRNLLGITWENGLGVGEQWATFFTDPDGSWDETGTRDIIEFRETEVRVNQFAGLAPNDGAGWLLVSEVSVNEPPTANAGIDKAIHTGDSVSLDGSASFDDNTATESLLYAWSFTTLPAGSAAVLVDATTATPTFIADVAGTYTVELVVTDEAGLDSSPDEVEISSDNMPPTANAGSDQLVITGDTVDLDGSGSNDPDMDPLTFSWSFSSKPVGSNATLSGGDTATPNFVADVEGLYEITLVVSDFIGPGTPDTVEITATTAAGFAESHIVLASDIVEALEPGQVTTAGNQNAFQNFLSQAIAAIQDGDLAKAIDKIEKSIERTDGCSLNGEPDGNGPGRDWITDCNAQSSVLYHLNEALDALMAL